VGALFKLRDKSRIIRADSVKRRLDPSKISFLSTIFSYLQSSVTGAKTYLRAALQYDGIKRKNGKFSMYPADIGKTEEYCDYGTESLSDVL
jgi:hypothetical protein